MSKRKRAAATTSTGSELRFYYKGSRHKQLRALVYTARLGSLSRAAETLYLSQPSVSLQLQALERELGVKLLERQRRRVELTQAGEILYELARPLIQGWEQLDRQFHAKIQGLMTGQLTVAAGASTLQYLLPRIVEQFRQRFPAVQLKLLNVSERVGLTMLREDKADFLVGSMLDVPADLSWTAVFHYDPMLITPLGHSLLAKTSPQLEDLSPYGLILPPNRYVTYRLVDLVFQRQQMPYQVAMEIGGWDVIKQYVAMGMGISIVTGICVSEEDQTRLGVRNMRHCFPRRSYGVTMRRGKALSDEARHFLSLLRPGVFAPYAYGEAGPSER